MANTLLQLLKDLGILCHPSKCELDPRPYVEFLGMKLHIPTQRFYLTTKQHTKLAEKVTHVLQCAKKAQRNVPKRTLATLLGYCQFCAGALKSGRFQLLDLYTVLNSKPGWHHKLTVKLSAPATRALEHYWINPPLEDQGRAWGPAEKVRVLQLVLSTDASKVAWGAHIHGKWESTAISGLLNLDTPVIPTASTTPLPFPNLAKNMRGAFNEQTREAHIHLLEYEAVY